MRLSVAGLAARGHVRHNNEDGVGCFPDDGLAVVCDGMGGSSTGAFVPPVVIAALRDVLRGAVEGSPDALRAAALEADARLRASLAALGMRGVGAGGAAGAVWLRGDRLAWVHAGDTRLYLLRGGALRRVWSEHTLANDPAFADAIPLPRRAELETQFRFVITRAFGVGEALNPDAGALTAAAGDVVLLASDGLWRELDDARIASILRDASTPDAAVIALFDALATTPWQDNASAVVARVFEGDPAPPAPAVHAGRAWARGRWFDPAYPRRYEAIATVFDAADDEAWERLGVRGFVPGHWHDDPARAYVASAEALGGVTARPPVALAAALGGAAPGALEEVDALAREARRRLRPWGFAGLDRVIFAPLPDAPQRVLDGGELATWAELHAREDDVASAAGELYLPPRWERWRRPLARVAAGASAWARGDVPVPGWSRAAAAHPYADLPSPWEPLWEVAARGYVVIEVAREGVVVGVPYAGGA